MPPRLLLFGPPSIEGPDRSTMLAFERRSQLVVLLALRRGWVGRAELAALLWPALVPGLAFGNLRKTVFRLQDLPWGRALESQGSALRYLADTDVHGFEQALADGRAADAVALYRGTLLAGFDDDANEAWTGWLRFERDRLAARWRAAALDGLADAADTAAGIERAARLLEADPLDEAALRAQMTLLARAGQASRARDAYRDFAARLAAELGIEPGPGLQAHHAALGAASAVPAVAPPAGGPGPDGGFVGRSAERRMIGELMARDDVRLLCITGPGGVGKTRLAERMLHELAPAYPQGAFFVALEDAASADAVGVAIARATGIGLPGRAPPLQELPAALHDRRMLLVLDNVEQLAAEAAALEGLLAGCPRLRLIATSRLRLGLAGEQLFPLEGLPCPEPEDEDRVEAFDAARLFVAAARRVAPSLQPRAEAAAIVEICRQVDGLPLALELAAGFARLMSCAAIAAELRAGTELLRTRDPARPARHASMQVVFDQSWHHLVAAEREALTRLAWFRGGFTAAAARSVAGVSLPVLAALADKSLLRKDGPRCHLHPLVQQLALERLGEGADRDSTAAAHASHYLRLMAELRPGIRHAEPRAMREADAEFENMRTAWRWTLDHGPAADLARAALSLMVYFDHRGRRLEGLALLDEALAGPALQASPAQAPVLSSAALLLFRLDRYAEAERRALQAIAAARRAGDTATRMPCATVLGACSARQGRLGAARRWFRHALVLAQAMADATHCAQTLDNLAFVERARGYLDASLQLYRQALLQHRELGDFSAEAMCLNNLGVLHVLRGESDAAGEMLRQARQLCARHGLPTTRCMVENNLADVALRAGDSEAALVHARIALDISRTTGQRAVAVEARQVLMRVALQRGDPAGARLELQAVLEGALAVGRPSLLAHGLCRFAELLAATGDDDCAALVMALALRERAIVGAERSEAEALLLRCGGAPDEQVLAAAPSPDEIAHRIVVETALAHAPLRARLRQATAAQAVPAAGQARATG